MPVEMPVEVRMLLQLVEIVLVEPTLINVCRHVYVGLTESKALMIECHLGEGVLVRGLVGPELLHICVILPSVYILGRRHKLLLGGV